MDLVMNKSKGIIVFTLHKSASMFIHKQCELLTELSGIEYHSTNKPECNFRERKILTNPDLWRNRTGCFAPIRFYVDVPNIDDYDVILHLRDPRDVLVSMFYSYCYIHGGPVDRNAGYREEVAKAGIDAFVLARATEERTSYPGDYGTGGVHEDLIGNVPKRYSDYVNNLLGKPNVTLVRYEEMMGDYRSWLSKFIQPFPLENKSETIDDFVNQSAKWFPDRKQDEMKHIRQAAPGDHCRKLQSSTIERLNEIFGDTLDALESAS